MLSRGIGNLIGMPLAIAVGRRIVLLTATAIMVVGAILCAFASNFEWHLGARMLIGIAAGQSEALVPMITQVSNGNELQSTHHPLVTNSILSL
jgi:predicted MFS family arabinose efflux permease